MSNQTRNVLLVLVAIAIVAVIITLENPFQQGSSVPAEQSGRTQSGMIAGQGANQTEPPPLPQIGHPAPHFVLSDIDGNSVRLDSFRGKVVLINFWATWCPFCVFEMPDMERMFKIFSGDLIVLAINTGESRSKVRRFVEENEISYPVLLDTEGEVTQAYRIRGMPTSYYVDRNGIIRQIRVGYHTLSDMEEIIRSILY